MLGSLLIFLREGIEGSMIVSIMCTYLAAAGRRDLFRWVFAGVAAALCASTLGAVALYAVVKDGFIDSTGQTWFETGVFLLATAVLTYMTFWMKRHARSINSQLKAQVSAAVTGGSALALALLAFVTVGREAVETVIFLLAITLRSSPMETLLGAVIGLSAALAVSIAMYRLGLKVNLKRFFMLVGAALMIVAAGLLANAVQNLQALGVLPGAGHALWDTSGLIADSSGLGDVLHGIFGYAAAPTALQAGTWAIFLVVGLATFLGRPATVFSRLASRSGERQAV